MKNEDLYVYKKSDFYEDYISSQKEYYERENADAYFAERLAEKDKEIAELKQKLEDVQASMYCDVVDANMEIRRLKRALYNLRACHADMMQKRYIECKCDGWVHRVDKWIEVERKCRAKAEQYK